MVNKNDKWSALSMKERADLFKLYVNNGITNIRDIRKHYNSFSDGGPSNTPIDGGELPGVTVTPYGNYITHSSKNKEKQKRRKNLSWIN